MDAEVKELCDKLFERYEKHNGSVSYSSYQYTLDHRIEIKMNQLANELAAVRRELEVEQNKSMVWKESYLELVRESVRREAKLLMENEQ